MRNCVLFSTVQKSLVEFPMHALVFVANGHGSRSVGFGKMFKQMDLHLLRVLRGLYESRFRIDGILKKVLGKDGAKYGFQLCKAITSGWVTGAIRTVPKSVWFRTL